MATLQATKQWSATTARAHLKQVCHQRPTQFPHTPEPKPGGSTSETPPSATSTPLASVFSRPYHDRLTEIEQRQLLVQTVAIYPGWQLVSVQHRPESDVLVAHMIPSHYQGDPVVAIREGHAMQLIMDATGDFKLQHPRSKRANILARFLRWLASGVSGSAYSVALA
jgi:hypothetical protein